MFWSLSNLFFMAVKKGQIVRVDKEKYLNSVNVSFGFIFLSFLSSFCFFKVLKLLCSWRFRYRNHYYFEEVFFFLFLFLVFLWADQSYIFKVFRNLIRTKFCLHLPRLLHYILIAFWTSWLWVLSRKCWFSCWLGDDSHSMDNQNHNSLENQQVLQR